MRDQRNQVVMDSTKLDDQLQKQEYSSMRSGDDHDDDDDHGDHDDQEDCGMLPGFRFHPTDEELVGFYLRRKVEKRPIAFEIIKQIDIYKYDPWDLPKVSSVGDKEWYFFCMRGRKYKNSIRPNRVTGSGFWKATGIDKPIFSVKQPHETIGLKKSLVYYRGTAGKGTKTDWMMHEFRLPPPPSITTTAIEPAAEVWTLCRIFRRVPSYRKYLPAVKGLISTKLTKQNSNIDSSSKTCSSSLDSDCSEHCVTFDGIQQYFQNPSSMKPFTIDARNNQQSVQHWNNMCYARSHQFPAMNTNYWSFSNAADDLIEEHANWDELRSVVELALN